MPNFFLTPEIIFLFTPAPRTIPSVTGDMFLLYTLYLVPPSLVVLSYNDVIGGCVIPLIMGTLSPSDGVQQNMSTFSTHALILGHRKNVSQFS